MYPLLCCLLVLMLLAPLSVQAATRYVNQATGHDGNHDCTAAQNPATPKATINGGLACTQGGDTLEIAGGTYAECLLDTGPTPLRPGSSWTSPTTVRATPGAAVWLRTTGCAGGAMPLNLAVNGPRYYVFDGLKFNGIDASPNCVITGGATHVKFHNIEGKHCAQVIQGGFHHSEFLNIHAHHQGYHENGAHTCHDPSLGCHGLYITGGNNLLERIYAHENTGIGVTLSCEGCGAGVKGNTIRGSTLAHNGGAGIMIYAGNLAHSNLSYGNYVGIWGYGDIVNNTVVDNHGAGIGIYTSGGSYQSVRNNIILGHTQDIAIQSGQATYSENLCSQLQPNFGCVKTGTAAALFVNAAGKDFHLRPGAPAIDSGQTVAAVDMDYDKQPRPSAKYDIGAYEYMAGGSQPPQPPAPPAPTNLRLFLPLPSRP